MVVRTSKRVSVCVCVLTAVLGAHQCERQLTSDTRARHWGLCKGRDTRKCVNSETEQYENGPIAVDNSSTVKRTIDRDWLILWLLALFFRVMTLRVTPRRRD